MTINQFNKNLLQATHLIKRITNKHEIKERDTLCIPQALVTSRVTYGTPYLGLKNSEEKINTLIHKAHKIPLGLPQTTSTEKLLALGVHNTWEECHEVHKTSQIKQLNHMRMGQDTFRGLGYRVMEEQDCKFKASPELRSWINVATTPLNMHPEHHEHRWQARTQALSRHYGGDKNVWYVDAAIYPGRNAYTLRVVDNKGKMLNAPTIKAHTAKEEEEAAISLASITAHSHDEIVVLSDLQTTCRHYLLGRLNKNTQDLLEQAHGKPPARAYCLGTRTLIPTKWHALPPESSLNGHIAPRVNRQPFRQPSKGKVKTKPYS